jgi:transketolase
VTFHFAPPAEIARVRSAIGDRYDRARATATLGRINALSMIGYAGSGHVGTSFSAMDIVTWLFTEVLERPAKSVAEDGDIYYSSKGHDVPGLYATLIGLGLLEPTFFTKLRRLDGLPGHPDVGVPYMITNTGSLGMGISKARGLAIADRLDGKRRRIIVLTGDGELQEGQFWESLQPTANGGFSEITVIVDHNKLQSDTFVSDVSDLGDLEKKIRAFGWEVARCDGHDPAALEVALRELAEAIGKPRLLIADTIKGKGVSLMEPTGVGADKLYKFHSGAPAAEAYAIGIAELSAHVNALLEKYSAVPVQLESVAPPIRYVPASPERLIHAYADELVKLGREHPEIIALDADLVVDCGSFPFKQEFPERFIECGIAEQDMVSMAGALALRGKLPVVHSFACFLSTRPNEQIYNVATENTKVIYHSSLAGLLPAAPGHSHQSVRDISTIGSNPGIVLIQPANEQATRAALRWAVEQSSTSTYLRLVSIPCPIPFTLPADYSLRIGVGTELKAGRDGVIIAYGPVMLAQAFEAAVRLEEKGRSLAVIDLPWLNRVDPVWLAAALRDRKRLYLVEDHYPQLGQSAFVAQAMVTHGIAITTRIYGVEEIPRCGQVLETLAYHRLDAASLAERIVADR